MAEESDSEQSTLSQEQPDFQNSQRASAGEEILGKWRDEKKASFKMARGAAVVDGNMAYFMSSSGVICSYNSEKHEWSELPKCPHEYSSLAIIKGCITAIGGIIKREPKTATTVAENKTDTATSSNASPQAKKEEERPDIASIGENAKEETENQQLTDSELTVTAIDGTSDEETETEDKQAKTNDGKNKEPSKHKLDTAIGENTKEEVKSKLDATIGENAKENAKDKTDAADDGSAKSQPKKEAEKNKPTSGNVIEEVVDKLLSIAKEKDQTQWKEYFPPMPTKREGTAAVCTDQHLIVAGGRRELTCLNTVEVMTIDTQVWSTSKAARLPYPYFKASATICGDQLYMLGGNDDTGYTKSVLTCSLSMLLKSCSETLSDSRSIWKKIKDAPVYYSSCTVVGERALLAVGGVDDTQRTTACVYKYNQANGSWGVLNTMQTSRYHPLVAVLKTDNMIAVGGKQIPSLPALVDFIDKVEIADIIHH